jgi:hypothetical protein
MLNTNEEEKKIEKKNLNELEKKKLEKIKIEKNLNELEKKKIEKKKLEKIQIEKNFQNFEKKLIEEENFFSIFLMGLPGSGKTTQTNLIKNYKLDVKINFYILEFGKLIKKYLKKNPDSNLYNYIYNLQNSGKLKSEIDPMVKDFLIKEKILRWEEKNKKKNFGGKTQFVFYNGFFFYFFLFFFYFFLFFIFFYFFFIFFYFIFFFLNLFFFIFYCY